MRCLRQIALILCAAWAVAAVAAPPVEGPVRAQHLTVELLPLDSSIQPGGTSLIGLHFTLDKGWHVYWVNAGDSGEPPSVKCNYVAARAMEIFRRLGVAAEEFCAGIHHAVR